MGHFMYTGNSTSDLNCRSIAKSEGSQFIAITQHEKNGFVTATKLGTTKKMLLQPKILLQQPIVLLTELYILSL